MNQELISLVKYYNRNENKMFAEAMLQWAMLSGFRNVEEKDEIVSFNDHSFSTKSAENSFVGSARLGYILCQEAKSISEQDKGDEK